MRRNGSKGMFGAVAVAKRKWARAQFVKEAIFGNTQTTITFRTPSFDIYNEQCKAAAAVPSTSLAHPPALTAGRQKMLGPCKINEPSIRRSAWPSCCARNKRIERRVSPPLDSRKKAACAPPVRWRPPLRNDVTTKSGRKRTPGRVGMCHWREGTLCCTACLALCSPRLLFLFSQWLQARGAVRCLELKQAFSLLGLS